MDPKTGRIVSRGQTGEICARGYMIMRCYYNNPVATDQCVDKEGWLHTGDLGTLDEHDYCRITGRLKDMIIRGGENIYPIEIEELLYTHPAVSDVQVIGVPDKKYGEEVMAWIKLKKGATATAEVIKAFCKGKVAHFKIQKFKMREESTTELELEEAARMKTA